MADLTHTHTPAAARFSPLAFFERIYAALATLGESTGVARSLMRISEMSDADIEARGTSREELIRKVLSAYGAV